MTIANIRDIAVGSGSAFRPIWPDGDASPDWSEVEWRCFANATGCLFGGGWEGEVGTLKLDPYPYDEICVMLSGRVALVDENGDRREFTGGDAFFVPKGFRGTWLTLEPSKKIFVGMVEPENAGAGPASTGASGSGLAGTTG